MNKQIEFLRGVAILAVIGVHTTMFFVGTVTTWLTLANLYLDVLFHYAVPLFVAISGYVLALKYAGALDIRHFYGRRLSGILPPYLLTSLLFYILPNLYIYKTGGTVGEILYQVLTFSTEIHFWFFIIILELYLCYPLILKAYNFGVKRWGLTGTLACFALVQIVSAILCTKIDLFLEDIFYFVLGLSLYRYQEELYGALRKIGSRMLPGAMVLVSLGAAVLWYNFYLVSRDMVYMQMRGLVDTVLYSLIILWCFYLTRGQQVYGNKLSAFVGGVLGKYSFGIYLVQMCFITAGEHVLAGLGIGHTEVIFYPLLYVSALGLSLLCAYLVHQVPYGFLLLGRVRDSM
jgi:surface polysaccharide O-acyltransferase-like enzyme